jgi:hypothetical protein
VISVFPLVIIVTSFSTCPSLGQGQQHMTDLDNMALGWTILAPSPSDSDITRTLKELIGALPSHLQSNYCTSLTYDNAITAQALLVGDHMLAAEHLVRRCILTVLFQVRWCWTTNGSSTPVSQRVSESTLSCCLCARARVPKCDHTDDWIYWNFIVYDAVALNDHIYHWQHLTTLAGTMIPSAHDQVPCGTHA